MKHDLRNRNEWSRAKPIRASHGFTFPQLIRLAQFGLIRTSHIRRPGQTVAVAEELGLLGKCLDDKDRKYAVRCPWAAEHAATIAGHTKAIAHVHVGDESFTLIADCTARGVWPRKYPAVGNMKMPRWTAEREGVF
jgi:hypothetical protein